MQKTFTFEDANRALVFVGPIVGDIQKTWQSLVMVKKILESAVMNGASITSPELAKMESDIQDNLKNIERFLKEIEQVGCIFKDFSRGVVDFPTFYKNEAVFLCWHSGEKSVAHWHRGDTGFENRKSVDEDFKTWNSKEPNMEFSLV